MTRATRGKMQPVSIIFVRMGVDSFFIKRNEIKVYSSWKTVLSMTHIYLFSVKEV